MRRTFCDGCNKEIERDYVAQRLRRSLNLNGSEWVIEIEVMKNQVTNNGNICRECLMTIITKGDPLTLEV